MRRIAAIDGNSLMHRAFHAVQTDMMAPDGRHTNAVFGFMQMLIKLIKDFEPDGVICAFDAGIPQFRMEAIQRYKAQRPPMDPNLREQFPIVEDLLHAMAIPVVKIPGWEGDDILGTLSAMGDAAGIETYLVTGDRDTFQLASEDTKIVYTRVGLSDVKLYGPDEVLERYGIGPELVPDYIALKGDPSDNIPGVPGVGEKTAAKLLVKYGSAQGIVEHADELTGKVKDNIQNNVDALEAGIVVATIVRDLDIDIDLNSVEFPAFDPKQVVDAFKQVNFTSQLAKILAFADEDVIAANSENEVPVELVPDTEAMGFVLSLNGESQVAILRERCGGDGMLFASGDKLAVCCGERVAILKDEEQIVRALTHLVGCCSVTSLDCKALLSKLVPPDSSKQAEIDIDKVDMQRMFDVSLAAYLLQSSRSSYTLEYLASEYLGIVLPVREKPKRGENVPELSDEEIAKRANIVLRLREVMEQKLEEDGSIECYRTIDMPLVPVLVKIERAGLQLDVSRMEELSEQIGAQIEQIQNDIYAEVGEEFNIASPKQLATILFEKLKLPASKKSRTGYSTDASVLQRLAEIHPVPAKVLEYRELAKIKNTYLDTLPNDLLGDHRVHTTFNQTIAATGRLSSSDPNLQNIPVRTELGRMIRTAFTPYSEMGSDAVFLSADYSQIELRLLAHLSGDQGLIDAFNSGSDFHAATAARVFGVDPSEVTPTMRSRAKAVNFGIVYGQQAFGLGRSLHIPMADAQDMIDRYFDAYPSVKTYLDGLVEQAKTQGYVETLFGRKRHVPEVNSSNGKQRQAAERVAMNHPMQGSAADVIKLAMIAVSRQLREQNFDAVMMLQIHDELDFSCPASQIEALSEMVVNQMENVVSLSVPMEVSVSYGPTWADAK